MRNPLTSEFPLLLSPEPTTAPTPAKKNANRYDSLFVGTVIKHSSDTTTVYGEEGGRKSKKLADVVLTLRDGCGVITGKIQAVQQKGQNKPRAEFSFTASMRGGQALVADSDKAERDLDIFKAGIVSRYMTERKARIADNNNDAPEAAAAVLDDLSL